MSGGGGQVIIDPGIVRNHAAGQISSADRFYDTPPPPIPDDGSPDPMGPAVRDFQGNVTKTRDGHRERTQRHSGALEAGTTALENQDQDNAQAVSAIAPKDQATMMSGVLKDFMGTATGGAKDVIGIFTATGQALSAAAGSGLTAAASAGSSAAGAAAGAAGKMQASPPGGSAGLAPVAGAGGSGDDRDKRGETKPAAATTPYGASGPGGRPLPFDHNKVHTEEQDRDDRQVRTAGFSPTGMGAGAMGASPGSAGAGKPVTRQVVYGKPPVDDETPTGPLDTEQLVAVAGAAVVRPTKEPA